MDTNTPSNQKCKKFCPMTWLIPLVIVVTLVAGFIVAQQMAAVPDDVTTAAPVSPQR